MTIIIISISIFILYRIANNNPIFNCLFAGLVVGLFTFLLPELRSLPILAYVSAFAVAWFGFQVFLPASEAQIEFGWMRNNLPVIRIGRVALTVLPQGV